MIKYIIFILLMAGFFLFGASYIETNNIDPPYHHGMIQHH